MQRSTIDDVAQAAAVSIKTVSRVLNHEPNVRESTRQRVMAAVESLNYHPSQSARSLAGSRSYVIGLLYNNPSANYMFDLQTGAMERCRQDRFQLIIHDCTRRRQDIAKHALGLIDQTHADGLVLSAPVCDEPLLLDALHQRSVPYVCIAPNQSPHHASYSFMDDRAAAREITDHLLGLGHRRIAVIVGHPDHYSAVQRLLGFKDSMKAAGVEPNMQLQKQGFYDFESGYTATRELLALATPPSAILACNDDMAAGALMAAHEANMNVPNDLSVAGFDDTYISKVVWPRLTTVHQPIQEMAKVATDQLIRQLKSGAQSEPKRIDHRLVVRDSTGPAPT